MAEAAAAPYFQRMSINPVRAVVDLRASAHRAISVCRAHGLVVDASDIDQRFDGAERLGLTADNPLSARAAVRVAIGIVRDVEVRCKQAVAGD